MHFEDLGARPRSVRIVDCGLGAGVVAELRSTLELGCQPCTAEVVELATIVPDGLLEEQSRSLSEPTLWIICFGRAPSVCLAQSVLGRIGEHEPGVLILGSELGPLRAAFGTRSVSYVQYTADKEPIVEAVRSALGKCTRSSAGAIMQHAGERSIVGRSPNFLGALGRARIAARHDGPVVIQGETGAGKELIARAIHYMGARQAKPFIPVQCAATPVDLFENELFGHEQGAYTGATGAQTGIVESAEGGTLFLDEIDTLPPIAQAKILRLLQEKEYKPLGTARVRSANIRILSASNTDLRAAVAAGRFREDLFFRLSLVTIKIPPLRERRGDVELLARHFLAKYSKEHGKTLSGFSPRALASLREHTWPGNVRELDFAVQRAVLECEDEFIDSLDLDSTGGDLSSPTLSFHDAKRRVTERFEREYLENLLATHAGNISQASQVSGMGRKTLYRLMLKHGIETKPYRSGLTTDAG